MRSGAVFAALTLMAHVPGHSWPMLQAVGDESATVNENGSGGTHYRAVLNGYPGVFNLAASRAIKYKTPGQQSVSFKIARLFQNASVVCAVYVAAFSIVISS